MKEEVYIDGNANAGPKVVELPSTSTEDPLPPEPVKQYRPVEQVASSLPKGKPWDDFSYHMQFEEWWSDNMLGDPVPRDWGGMTIAKKKEWMDGNIEL